MNNSTSDTHFDAIVIGSGFGGSVTAYRLAEAGLSVCVLEWGKPYPPNSFPRSPHRTKNNFWDPSEGLYGMFNIWWHRNPGAAPLLSPDRQAELPEALSEPPADGGMWNSAKGAG
jgi:choline dehydrogenase-like flavoprotein